MVHWVEKPLPGRLGIMPRPRGGELLAGDMRRLRESGVHVLVSLLEPDEATELELALEAEHAAAEALVFHSLPIPDHDVPGDVAAFRKLVVEISGHLNVGASVAIHCFAGIGRSSVLGACVLAARGIPLAEAFRLLSECRGFDVPDTAEQRAWVERFVAGPEQD